MAIDDTLGVLHFVINEYQEARTALNKKVEYTDQYREGLIASRQVDAAARSERLAAKLWGSIKQQGDGSFILDGGDLWNRAADLEARLSAERARAERAGIDPAYVALARDRAAGLVNMADNPKDLMSAYKQAPRDVQIALEQSGAALLPKRQYPGLEWHQARQFFEKQRDQRQMTPTVKDLQNQIDVLNLQTFPTAIRLTQRARAEFGSLSPYLASVLHGVNVTQQRVHGSALDRADFTVSHSRVPWGTVAKKSGNVTTYAHLPGGNVLKSL